MDAAISAWRVRTISVSPAPIASATTMTRAAARPSSESWSIRTVSLSANTPAKRAPRTTSAGIFGSQGQCRRSPWSPSVPVMGFITPSEQPVAAGRVPPAAAARARPDPRRPLGRRRLRHPAGAARRLRPEDDRPLLRGRPGHHVVDHGHRGVHRPEHVVRPHRRLPEARDLADAPRGARTGRGVRAAVRPLRADARQRPLLDAAGHAADGALGATGAADRRRRADGLRRGPLPRRARQPRATRCSSPPSRSPPYRRAPARRSWCHRRPSSRSW